MITPDCFNTSLTEAEQYAFEKLLDATNSKENKQGFKGLNPDIINAWAFEILKSANNEVFLAPDTPRLCVNAQAECVYFDREECQKWFMSILAALPIQNDEDSSIVEFRISDESKIEPEIIAVKNDKDLHRVYRKTITFDLVFETGGKDNAL